LAAPPSPRAPLWLCTVVLACVACGRIEGTRQCQALVATVNPALDAIDQRRKTTGSDPRASSRIADRYDRLAHDVAALPFSNPELQRLAVEYAGQFHQTAAMLRVLSPSSPGPDAAAGSRARAELASIVQREKALVRRIGQLCQAPG